MTIIESNETQNENQKEPATIIENGDAASIERQQDIEKQLIEEAVLGNQKSLEALLLSVQDMVFNLSLRMLGMVHDAEDATQEILIKVMTHLSSFRQESKFSTWVYRIAVNHLRNYQKSMFAKHPLSFEYYGADIVSGKEKDVPDRTNGVDSELLAQELKYSCTNVMLQCLDADSRCIYILGTMFRLDSSVAGEILDLTPEAYRQRLSRVRRKMGEFLGKYCGLSGTGVCACGKRVNYAISSHRINPDQLDFLSLEECERDKITGFSSAMDQIDDISQVFTTLPSYRSTEKSTVFIRNLMDSDLFSIVRKD